jgi:hypothetical protein
VNNSETLKESGKIELLPSINYSDTLVVNNDKHIGRYLVLLQSLSDPPSSSSIYQRSGGAYNDGGFQLIYHLSKIFTFRIHHIISI